MSAETRQATIQDMQALPDDGHRYDLIRGEIIQLAPATGEHGAIAGEIARLIGNVARPERRGRVYTAEAGFVLAHDPDVLLCPDVSFVRSSRLGPLDEQRGFLDLAPDLAVEVLSPSESLRSIREKVSAYLDGGTQAVWVVDPVRRSVTVYLADGSITLLSEDEDLTGGDMLPGFNVTVAEIFE
ncbi:Uma2 family endonuclease [soil metagenome]